MWPSSSTRSRQVEKLEQLLRDGSSVYMVWWETPLRLVRRVDPTVQTLTGQALCEADPDRSGSPTGCVVGGRRPAVDPDGAYRDAVRAVDDDIARPLVLPDDPGATLSKVNAHLRQAKHKVGAGPAPGQWVGDAPLLAMLERLWEGQVSRHGGGPRSRDQTLEETRAAAPMAGTWTGFARWCAGLRVDVLAASRVHVDAWARHLAEVDGRGDGDGGGQAGCGDGVLPPPGPRGRAADMSDDSPRARQIDLVGRVAGLSLARRGARVGPTRSRSRLARRQAAVRGGC